jgi:hypothetical protein
MMDRKPKFLTGNVMPTICECYSWYIILSSDMHAKILKYFKKSKFVLPPNLAKLPKFYVHNHSSLLVSLPLEKLRCLNSHWLNSTVEWVRLLLHFKISQIKISAWRLIILTEIFHGYPQSLMQMLRYHLKLGHDHFLYNSFVGTFHMCRYQAMNTVRIHGNQKIANSWNNRRNVIRF